KNVRSTFFHKDVSKLSADDLMRLYGRTRIRVLAACAPCQPFSGYTTKRRGVDDRWKLLLEVLRLTSSVLPEIVTVENVARLRKRSLWTQFVRGLEASGYHVEWDVLDASTFGVPQSRKRLVLLASRLGPISLPKARARKAMTVRRAIANLPPLRSGAVDDRD